jgi:hypothetical protein
MLRRMMMSQWLELQQQAGGAAGKLTDFSQELRHEDIRPSDRIVGAWGLCDRRGRLHEELRRQEG